MGCRSPFRWTDEKEFARPLRGALAAIRGPSAAKCCGNSSLRVLVSSSNGSVSFQSGARVLVLAVRYLPAPNRPIPGRCLGYDRRNGALVVRRGDRAWAREM